MTAVAVTTGGETSPEWTGSEKEGTEDQGEVSGDRNHVTESLAADWTLKHDSQRKQSTVTAALLFVIDNFVTSLIGHFVKK